MPPKKNSSEPLVYTLQQPKAYLKKNVRAKKSRNLHVIEGFYMMPQAYPLFHMQFNSSTNMLLSNSDKYQFHFFTIINSDGTKGKFENERFECEKPKT